MDIKFVCLGFKKVFSSKIDPTQFGTTPVKCTQLGVIANHRGIIDSIELN